MNTSAHSLVATSLVFVVAGFLPTVGRAQANDDAADRRQAILQQDELVTDDGQLIDQDAALIRGTRATFRSSPDSSPFQEVRWRRGAYYGRPYGAYYRPYGAYYGPRYSPGYPRYYDPYYGGYGYRSYYGPRYGYYRYGDPYYGRPYGAARVGPFRVIW